MDFKFSNSAAAGVFEEPSLGLLPPSNVVVMEGDFNKSDIVVQITKPSTIFKALHNQSPKLRGILSETGAAYPSASPPVPLYALSPCLWYLVCTSTCCKLRFLRGS